jgi:predicted membrane protein
MALDLTKATLDPGGASVELDTRMGGIEVRVPTHWSVEVEQEMLGGGLKVNVASPEDLPEDAPKLRIHAVTRMGGGEVNAKAT